MGKSFVNGGSFIAIVEYRRVFGFFFGGVWGFRILGKSGAASKQVSSLSELRPCSDFDLMISKDRNHTLELRGIGISAAVGSQNMGFTSNLLHFYWAR